MYGAILPEHAPLSADVTLLLELAMGATLVFGAWLARRGRYGLHGWCQSLVVLLNLAVIALTMVSSWEDHVLPKIPAKLGRSFYAIATAHAVLGVGAEASALYVVVAAGTKLLPERLRFRNFRRTMRAVLALWWLALLFGVATYLRWYGAL